MPSIRNATTADAAALSRLAATTFRETFEAENSPEDMERYLAEAFTPEQQAAEISDTAGTILVAEHHLSSDDVVLVGYAHLISGSTTAAVAGSMPRDSK